MSRKHVKGPDLDTIPAPKSTALRQAVHADDRTFLMKAGDSLLALLTQQRGFAGVGTVDLQRSGLARCENAFCDSVIKVTELGSSTAADRLTILEHRVDGFVSNSVAARNWPELQLCSGYVFPFVAKALYNIVVQSLQLYIIVDTRKNCELVARSRHIRGLMPERALP